MNITINYLAVFVAGISSMVLGALWYGPLFGKVWIKLMGFTDAQMKQAKEKGMAKSYIINFIGALVMAYVLAHFVAVWDVVSATGALQLAFWTWLGFVATVLLGSVLWEGKSLKLYFINVCYQLVAIGVAAVILAQWQ